MPKRMRHYDAEFMMTTFKVKLCPRVDQHNWRSCPFKHEGESQATRRHPSLYSPAYCADLKMHGRCAAGDRCPFSHNTFELSLHPERYKTTLCNLGADCNRDICFFAHSISELRTPNSSGSISSPAAASNPNTSASSPSSCRTGTGMAPAGGPLSPSGTGPNASAAALLFQARQQDYQQSLLAQECLAGIAAQQQFAALCGDAALMLPPAHAAAHAMAAQVAASAAAAAAAAVLAPGGSGACLTAGNRLQDLMDGLLPVSGGTARGDSFTSRCSQSSSNSFLPLQAQLAAASMPLVQSVAAGGFWPQFADFSGGQEFGNQLAAGSMFAADDGFPGGLHQPSMPVHVAAMLLGGAAAGGAATAEAKGVQGWPLFN